MGELIRISALGLVAAILTVVLKKYSRESAMVLTMAACVMICLLLLQWSKPVVGFLGRLQTMAGLEASLMQPMLKTIGIGLLTQISANVCADAGESAVAKLIELGGSVLAIYAALPLLEAVLAMVEQMGA